MQDHGRLSVVYIPKHSLSSWCWNSQDHGRLSVMHMSKHSLKNLHTCWTPWSALHKKRRLWARPPVLTPVPLQAIHSRACLNSHHSDIQGTAQKSPCVNTFLKPSQKKKNVTVWVNGNGGQDMERRARTRIHETTDT